MLKCIILIPHVVPVVCIVYVYSYNHITFFTYINIFLIQCMLLCTIIYLLTLHLGHLFDRCISLHQVNTVCYH